MHAAVTAQSLVLVYTWSLNYNNYCNFIHCVRRTKTTCSSYIAFNMVPAIFTDGETAQTKLKSLTLLIEICIP